MVKKQGNVKAMGIADVSSVPLADLDLSGDIMHGISKPSEPLSASPLSSTGKSNLFGDDQCVHIMAFVRFPILCRARNARSTNRQTR